MKWREKHSPFLGKTRGWIGRTINLKPETGCGGSLSAGERARVRAGNKTNFISTPIRTPNPLMPRGGSLNVRINNCAGCALVYW
jgi:hypothetical protein